MVTEQYAGEHGCRTYLPKESRVCMRPEVARISGRMYCERHIPKSVEPCGNGFEPVKLPSGKLSTKCIHCGWTKAKHLCKCGCGLGEHI